MTILANAPKTGVLCVNGILSDGAWNTAAALWFTKMGCVGESYRYWCGVLRIGFRWGWKFWTTNDDRAVEVVARLKKMRDEGCTRIVLVAHSNGNIIAAKVIALLRGTEITVEYHALAADVSPDLEATGMNAALRDGTISDLYDYASWGDMVLASDASLWGSGALGRLGPQHVADDVKDRVHTIRDDSRGHSDWVDPRSPADEGCNLAVMEEILNPAVTPTAVPVA